jgi:hypothetical protein
VCTLGKEGGQGQEALSSMPGRGHRVSIPKEQQGFGHLHRGCQECSVQRLGISGSRL